MSEEKRKSAFYLSVVDKKDKSKKTYVLNVWPGQFPDSFGVTINKELTEEQWLEIYRESKKGKEGSLWFNMNATKSGEKKAPKKDDSDAPF